MSEHEPTPSNPTEKEVYDDIVRQAFEAARSPRAVSMDREGLNPDDEQWVDQETHELTTHEGTDGEVAGKALTFPPKSPIQSILLYAENSLRFKHEADPILIMIFSNINHGYYNLRKSGKISLQSVVESEKHLDKDDIDLEEKRKLARDVRAAIEENKSWIEGFDD